MIAPAHTLQPNAPARPAESPGSPGSPGVGADAPGPEAWLRSMERALSDLEDWRPEDEPAPGEAGQAGLAGTAQTQPTAAPPVPTGALALTGHAAPRDPTSRAVRELATPGRRGPDPLGLSHAARQEAVSASGQPGLDEPVQAGEPGARASAEAATPSTRAQAGDQGRSTSAEPTPQQGQTQARPAQAFPGAAHQAPADQPQAHALHAASARPVQPAATSPAAGVQAIARMGAAGGAAAPSGPRGVTATPVLGVPGRAGAAGSTVRTPAATPPAPAGEAPVETQVLRGLAAALKQRGGSVTLRLAPEALGQVRVDLKISQGAVSVRIEAQTEPARRLLSETAPALRAALEDQGLRVDRLTVEPGPGERAGAAWSEPGRDESSRGFADADRSGFGSPQGGGGQSWTGAGGPGRGSAAEQRDGVPADGGAGGDTAIQAAHHDAELVVLGLDVTA